MFDIDEVNSTIEELENESLTFDICQKLANLYILREYSDKNENDVIISEYNDILPSYNKFCDLKRKYQLSEIPIDSVYKQLELLCVEISEFIEILYNNTDTQKERVIIKAMLQNITANK